MLIPTFRFFVVPASAILVLLALAANQSVGARAPAPEMSPHSLTASQQAGTNCINPAARPHRTCAAPAT